MNGTTRIPVLAFADSHYPYQGLKIHSDMNISFCTDLDQFYDKALNTEFSGIILEMRKVMKSPTIERNRIFSFTNGKPVMRALTKFQTAIFIDDPGQFKVNCKQCKCDNVRNYFRADVNIQAQLSDEEDYVMARELSAKVINISEIGCFVKTKAKLSENRFIHLKLMDLTNKCPIYCAIKWTEKTEDTPSGYGLQFMEIKENQLQEIKNKYL